MHEPITVRWLGHACFKVEKGAYSVVLDPYAPGSVPGLPDIRTDANLVLCSHGHSDHGCAEAVALRPAQDCPFSVTKIETFHDACGGAQRGPNTIHVLEADGMRIAHFGDLGCALTDAQANALQGVDVALIPVGGFYTTRRRPRPQPTASARRSSSPCTTARRGSACSRSPRWTNSSGCAPTRSCSTGTRSPSARSAAASLCRPVRCKAGDARKKESRAGPPFFFRIFCKVCLTNYAKRAMLNLQS